MNKYSCAHDWVYAHQVRYLDENTLFECAKCKATCRRESMGEGKMWFYSEPVESLTAEEIKAMNQWLS